MDEHDRLRTRFTGIVDDIIDYLKTGFSVRSPRPAASAGADRAAADLPPTNATPAATVAPATTVPGFGPDLAPDAKGGGARASVGGENPSLFGEGTEGGEPPRTPAPSSAPASSSGAEPPPSGALISKEERKRMFDAVVREVLSCTKCPLHRGRINAVPGKGSIDADVVFIGEGPGEMEDIKGEPFVGRAGQLLTKMLSSIGFTREGVYITNIVKCRPPNNRAPLPVETSTCFPYLERQLELIDPKIICCLGGPSAQAILSTTQGITRLRGSVQRYKGVPVVPTYHPAAVLRFPDKYKRDVWNDLKMLRDLHRDLTKS